MRAVPSVVVLGLFVSGIGCVQTQPAIDTSNPAVAGGPLAPSAQAVAYADLQPIFATDCLQCHSENRALGGYAMSTFAEVMKDVRPGDAASRLVVTTQPSGSMYRYWSGNQQEKAALVFNWVVVYNAQETR